jgi:L-malate glycosyltransferase
MKRIMVLDSNYPGVGNLYGDVFVHTRVREYKKSAIVSVVSFFRDIPDYEYDGVNVVHAPQIGDVFRWYNDLKPDAVFIHFYDSKLYEFIKEIKVPVVIWVHGYEALGWYRRLFNFSFYGLLRNVHRVAFRNLKQMIGVRRVIKTSNQSNRIHFVFVSKWMRRITETDAAIKTKNSSIIPNPINTSLFEYRQKLSEHRKKILLIRSFGSRKYANDVAVEAIIELSNRKFFHELGFTIFGHGKYFKDLTGPLRNFKNIEIHERFLDNRLIPEIHATHGIFLCPTRQDAQGVSMCEAMSSGLVPVTTNCTAIPEFVEHEVTGMLTRSAKDIADKIEQLYRHPELFQTISRNASEYIRETCSIDKITARELLLSNN